MTSLDKPTARRPQTPGRGRQGGDARPRCSRPSAACAAWSRRCCPACSSSRSSRSTRTCTCRRSPPSAVSLLLVVVRLVDAGHRQARLQRRLRRRLRRGLRDDDGQRQGLLSAGHALHAGPGRRLHHHDARRRAADRPDPRPGLQGEPLLAHPQPRPQEGVRQGQLGLGPDPARQVRDPLPALLVGRHHPAGLGAGRPEDPAVPAGRVADLGVPGEGAARRSTCSRRWRRRSRPRRSARRRAGEAAEAPGLSVRPARRRTWTAGRPERRGARPCRG